MPPPVVYAQPTYVTPPVWRWDGAYVGTNFGFGARWLVGPDWPLAPPLPMSAARTYMAG